SPVRACRPSSSRLPFVIGASAGGLCMAATPTIRTTNLVGRYALGVAWADGHDSILPFNHLRAHCPSDAFAAEPAQDAAPMSPRGANLESIELLGDASAYLRWSDGHETFYLLSELRALCRCAYCIGEPERPITG